jgi:hypothetical protein
VGTGEGREGVELSFQAIRWMIIYNTRNGTNNGKTAPAVAKQKYGFQNQEND